MPLTPSLHPHFIFFITCITHHSFILLLVYVFFFLLVNVFVFCLPLPESKLDKSRNFVSFFLVCFSNIVFLVPWHSKDLDLIGCSAQQLREHTWVSLWIQVPALLLSSYITWEKLLNRLFTICKMGMIVYLTVLPWELSELIHVKTQVGA